MHSNRYKIDSAKDVKLSKMETHPGKKIHGISELQAQLKEDIETISKFQNKLYAENRQSLLIILQGMDSSGKDGTIKHIMRGVNPQGVQVWSFKHPSDLELKHDYLWRHAQKLPAKGEITIFNRSHYENVLISKVHPQIVLAERIMGITRTNDIDKDFWNKRYAQINDFEKNIVQNGTSVLKFFLHISKKEQRNRFLERINNKEKHWKFSSDDIAERAYWDDYQKAYEQAISNTSTREAPWYIIPADDKLYAHMVIGDAIIKELKKMNPAFPSIDKKEEQLMQKAKRALEQHKK